MIGVARHQDAPYILASIGIEAELLDRLPEFGADMAALWGGWEQLQQFPLDEPIVHSQMLSPTLLEGNAYGAQWVARGVIDAAICTISRDAAMFGNVGFNRHSSAGLIGHREIDSLRLLTPHFRRSITISNLFDMKTIEAMTFGKLIDGFSFGILLVDAALTIIHANPVARTLLAARDLVRSESGALVLPNRSAHAALERAVHRASGENTALGSRGIGIPMQGDIGPASIIHVLPLKGGPLQRGLGQRTAAALFIAPAVSPARLPTDALALLYDLTPAEIRVFELIVAGEAPSSIASVLGVAPSTVRTHLIHLFQKTACRKQSELVKLAANLSFPI